MNPIERPSERGHTLADALALATATATLAAAALLRGLERRWQARSDLRRLQDFDDRLLADIGVERYEIARAVGKAPWLDYRVR